MPNQRAETLALTAVRAILTIKHPVGVRTDEKGTGKFVYVPRQIRPAFMGTSWENVLKEVAKEFAGV